MLTSVKKKVIARGLFSLGLCLMATEGLSSRAAGDELPSSQPIAESSLITDSCCNDPVLTIRAEVLFLHRQNVDDARFFVGPDLPVQSGGFDFGYETGWGTSLFWHLDSGWNLEARYFQVDDWSDSESFPLNEARLDVDYTSELRNAELNARKQVSCWLTGLVGFRYVNLEEEIASAFSGPLPTPITNSLETENHLFGLQIGAEAHIWSCGCFSLSATGKAGLFYNEAEKSVNLIIPDVDTITDNDRSSGLAFIGELGLTGMYQVTEQFALRAGYHLLWLEGVATSSGQLDPSAPIGIVPGINDNDGVFYHGAMVSAELSW